MLIGISGLAGSGKDTCADFLVRKHGFVKVGFADVMKRICRDVYGFSVEQLWGPSSARNAPDTRFPREHGGSNPFGDLIFGTTCPCCGVARSEGQAWVDTPPCFLTPRFALQQLGSEWGRACYSNTWVDYTLRVAELLSDGHHAYDLQSNDPVYRVRGPAPSNVVISDVRFKNEIDALKTAGAKLIRIVRPGAGLVGAASQHGSEAGQAAIPDDVFDGLIVNSGTLAELDEMITNFVQKWS